MDQLFACRYGTFLENSDRQRVQKKLDEKTAPFWWLVADDKSKFVNPDYDPARELGDDDDDDTRKPFPDPLIPSLSPKNIRFFEEYFLRFDPTIMPPRPIDVFY
mmetsp:Transcript_7032/g.18400  ORF Transcript_7032/g.18400 Transcript_7032/m.18400 type:complete len:104 (-) Transcript_7032:546-857(-)